MPKPDFGVPDYAAQIVRRAVERALGPHRRAEDRLRAALDRAVGRGLAGRLHRRGKRPDGKGEGAGEPAPVRPDRPLDLSGGAAAAMEFDD